MPNNPPPDINWGPPGELAFQGAPKWYAQYLEGILREARRVASMEKQPYAPLNPIQEMERDAAERAIRQQIPEGIPISITGSSRPIMFSPEEVLRAATDETFARHLYKLATGNQRILKSDVREFQARLNDEHPEIVGHAQEFLREPAERLGRPPIPQPEPLPGRQRRPFDAQAFLRQQQEAVPVPGPVAEQGRRRRPFDAQAFLAPRVEPPVPPPMPDPFLQPPQPQPNRFAQALAQAREERGLPPLPRPVAPPRERRVFDPEAFLAQQGIQQERQDPTLRLIEETRAAGRPLTRAQERYLEQAQAREARRPEAGAEGMHPGWLGGVDWDALQGQLGVENRAAALNKAREIADISSRIAPLPETFEQAKRRMEYNIDHDDDTFKVAREEMDAARHEHVKRDIEPYLQEASRHGDHYMQDYMDRYRQNVIGALRDEEHESFLEEVAPRINMSFAQHGAFHGGARNAALAKAAQKTERNLHREISRLMSHGEERAMEHAHRHRGMVLNAGQLAAEASKSQQGLAAQRAEILRNQAVTRKAMNKSDVDALREFAAQEQRQRQNEIDLRYGDYKEKQERPWTQLERESMIARGHPITAQQTFTAANLGQPLPPNPYNLAGGLLGQLTATGARTQEAPYKKGGHVKAKYAKGGIVNRWNELGKEVQPAQHEADMQGIANELRHYKEDPTINWIDRVSQAMLLHPHASGSENMGRGAAQASADREHAKTRMLDARAKAANLYDAINNTRLNQHKVLAEYENQKLKQADLASHRAASLAQAERHHKERMGIQQAAKPKLDAVDKDILQNANKQLEGAGTLLDDLDRMYALSDVIKTGTPSTKFALTNDPYVQSLLGQGEQQYIDEFDKLSNDFALKAAASFGPRAGARIAQMFKEAKPHRGMHTEGIKNVLKNIKHEVKKHVSEAVYINENYNAGIAPKRSLTDIAKQRSAKHNFPSLKELEAERENTFSPQDNTGIEKETLASVGDKLSLLKAALAEKGG